MNPLKTIGYRSFQTAFRLALPFLPYREPQMLTSVDSIPAVLLEEGKRKPLIVTDSNLLSLGLPALLTSVLDAMGISYSIFSDTDQNPTIANVEAARAQYLSDGCDCLIAFGGGSPMDCAKAAGARIVKPHQAVSSMKGILRVHKRIPLLIAIPTTAGTGSETTLAAVITDQDAHYKYPINDFPLIPAYAVLDARTTLGLPPYITAITGLDALVHATEAYIGRSTTKETRAWAEEAVRLISHYLKRAYDDGSDVEAREGMLRAAFLAGEAFSKSYVGYIHGIAHSLGGNYGTAHGLANAVTAPYVLRRYDFAAQRKLATLARVANIATQENTDRQAAFKFIEWFESLNNVMGIPQKISSIKSEDISKMARQADKESNPLYPVPRLMDKDELEQIYRLLQVEENLEPTRPHATVQETEHLKERSLDKIMVDQRAFFASGKTLDVDFRIAALKKLERAIKAHQAEIDSALQEDLGKSFFESYMCEVGLTLAELGYQLKHIRKWTRPHTVLTNLANFAAHCFTVAEPYGVTLVMSPWNYPFMLTLEPLIGAIAAGNCCVVKPSAYSPKTSAVIARIIEEVFEPGHVDVVEGGREQNAALLDQKFDYIFFTGSVAVGKLVLEKAAPHLTPVTLELGGKSPCVVAADANLEIAAMRIAFGKFLNLGQTCVAPDYVLVDRKVEMRFVELIVDAICKMYGVYALDNPDYGHMINEKHFKRVLGLIDPDKVIFGGGSDPATLQIEPTVMMGVTAEDAVMKQEIFGPILPIIAFDSLEEAKVFIKKREKPLAAYLFTSNKEEERTFLREVSFGGGCINDTIVHLATSYMSFGGVGASGMGSYHGKQSFETFSHRKSIMKKYTGLDLPMRYQPYDALKLMLIKMFVR